MTRCYSAYSLHFYIHKNKIKWTTMLNGFRETFTRIEYRYLYLYSLLNGMVKDQSLNIFCCLEIIITNSNMYHVKFPSCVINNNTLYGSVINLYPFRDHLEVVKVTFIPVFFTIAISNSSKHANLISISSRRYGGVEK
ncbi:hypothetical protein D3C78_1055800 [compost metagenome]